MIILKQCFFFEYLGSRYIVIVVVLVNTIELYIGKYVTFQQFSDDGTWIHSELPWGHRKISKIDETYIKLKFGTSDGIIVHYFCNFDWILAKFCNFMIGGRGLISLFWLIFISKWTIDCSYLWWRVEFLPNENISKLTCNRRFCW